MTIFIDHLNLERESDPGYWYIWAADFKNTFIYLFTSEQKLLKRKRINIDRLPPQPGHLSMWIIYFSAIELYLKTFLIKEGDCDIETLRTKYGHRLKELLQECKNVSKLRIPNEFENRELNEIIEILQKMTKTDDWTVIRYPGKSLGMLGRDSVIKPLLFLEERVKSLVWVKD
ncbi:MAG: hypothetical protein RLZZ455_131 [Candidatus Parcubacteria bacterium]|jgi:hypothetical protein